VVWYVVGKDSMLFVWGEEGGEDEKKLAKHCSKELIISRKCLSDWNSGTGKCAQVKTMCHKLTAVSTAILFACHPPPSLSTRRLC